MELIISIAVVVLLIWINLATLIQLFKEADLTLLAIVSVFGMLLDIVASGVLLAIVDYFNVPWQQVSYIHCLVAVVLAYSVFFVASVPWPKRGILKLNIKLLTAGAKEPELGDPRAACYDLYCPAGTVPVETTGSHLMVPLGIQIEIPEGYHAKIYPRSSLPLKYKATLGNCVGIIDSGFLDEWKLIIEPVGWDQYDIDKFMEACNTGAKLAQVEFVKNGSKVKFNQVQSFGKAYNRGGGFGSTGK